MRHLLVMKRIIAIFLSVFLAMIPSRVINFNLCHFRLDLGSPEGVAVDWISKNIYWTDSGRDRIDVVRFDGTSRKNLIAEGLVNPRAIAVDPIRG